MADKTEATVMQEKTEECRQYMNELYPMQSAGLDWFAILKFVVSLLSCILPVFMTGIYTRWLKHKLASRPDLVPADKIDAVAEVLVNVRAHTSNAQFEALLAECQK